MRAASARAANLTPPSPLVLRSWLTAHAFRLFLLSAHGLHSVSLHLYGAGDLPVRNLRVLLVFQS